MLPLALGIAGAMAKDRPLAAASWQSVHDQLHAKRDNFMDMEEEAQAALFSAIEASRSRLPLTQQRQLQLMVVLAPGVVATCDMLANLWDTVCM